jgi:Outer membrane protein beta-barrel domain
MNERDFDKLFSDKLNHEGDFPNKDKVKASVFSRLDNELPVASALPISDTKGSTLLKSLWALPFLLLLLGWNSCQWWQMKNLTQQNLSLQADIKGWKTATSTRTLSHDTVIYQSRTIYKTDTIYKTVYLFEKNISTTNFSPNTPPSVSEHKLTENNINISNNKSTQQITETPNKPLAKTTAISDKTSTDKSLDFKASEKPITLINKDTLATKTLVTNNRDSTEIAAQTPDSLKKQAMKSADSMAIKEIGTIKESPNDSFEQALNKQSFNEAESTLPIIKKLKWGDTYLGFNTGIAALTPATKNINPSLWWGVSAEYAFDDNWRIALSTDWSRLNFKTYGPSAPLNLPEINSPGSQYRFKYIEGTQKATQYGVALQYCLKAERTLKPFVSLGYIYRTIPANMAKYEFTNTLTGEERYVYQDIDKHIDHWWLLGFGANTRLNAHFSARLKLEYAHEFSNNTGRAILRGGILYRF